MGIMGISSMSNCSALDIICFRMRGSEVLSDSVSHLLYCGFSHPVLLVPLSLLLNTSRKLMGSSMSANQEPITIWQSPFCRRLKITFDSMFSNWIERPKAVFHCCCTAWAIL